MKTLTILILTLFCGLLKAQNKTEEITTYKYKINPPFINNNKDTIKIEKSNLFKLNIDTSSFGDSLKLIQTKLIDKHASQIILKWDKEYTLKEGESISFEFKIERKTKVAESSKTKDDFDTIAINLIVIHQEKPKEKNADEKMRETVTASIKEALLEESKDKGIGQFEIKNYYIKGKLNSSNNCTQQKKKNSQIVDLKIDSIYIRTEDGAIARRGLFVKAIDTITKIVYYFRNMQAPIELAKNERRYGDTLFLANGEGCQVYINYGELLQYTFIGKFSYPDNGEFFINQQKKIATVSNKISLKDIINISIFTDLLSLLGRRANGVIQTEFNATFITNTKNTINKDKILWSFISPYFAFSKFDSKFQQIDSFNANIKKINGKDSINRLYINQIAYIKSGLKLNIFKRSFWPNEQMQINVGAEMTLTNADSIYKKDLVMLNYYPEILYKVTRMENFGMEASIRYLVQTPAKNLNFYNDKPSVFFNPQVTLYYYPFSNPDNRIYFKYAHFAEIGAKGNNSNYPILQFGYKTNLFKKDK